jgi:CIC family chloride channel protein
LHVVLNQNAFFGFPNEMNINRLYHKFIIWRVKHLSNRNFILLIAFVTGIAAGIGAAIMKNAAHYVKYLLTLGVPAHYHNYLFFVYPLIGILLTVTLRVVFRWQSYGHGMTSLLMDISKRSSIVVPEKMYSHIVSASLTVGFGGSVGLEAPIVTTGAAIGSNLGRFFHLSHKKRTLLLACGVAAGIGGVFNAPIAGIIFCLEVLLIELSVPAFIPLLIAAITGTIVTRTFAGSEVLFNYSISDDFYLKDIPFFLVLSVFTGIVSIYFLRTFNKTIEKVNKIKDTYARAIWGGLGLGLMIFIFPPLYGEGYGVINSLINTANPADLLKESFFFHTYNFDWFILLFAGGIIAIKAFASAATVGAGGNGGNIAPSLFLGGICGFFIAHLVNATHLLPWVISEKNFILVGMAGIMSGVLRAPLTSIFLIAELTGGYTLILPLMIVSAISYATSAYMEPHSVYIKQLANKGHIHYHDKDRVVLTALKLNKLIEKDFVPVNASGSLRNIVDAVASSSRNIFPVLDNEDILVGIINLDDVRQYLFKPELYGIIKIADLMHQPADYILYSENMEEAMKKFDMSNAWNLPVVNDQGVFIGLISKSKIFSFYRSNLKKQTQEDAEIIE